MLRRSPFAACLVLGCTFGSSGAGAGGASTSEESGSSDGGPGVSTSSSASQGTTSVSGSATGVGPTTSDSMGSDGSSATSGGPDTTASGGGMTTATDTGADTATDTGSGMDCTLRLAEALTSLDGADDGREWVVLYNPCGQSIDLGPLSLAWGSTGYAGAVDLVGTVAAGTCFVVGGPDSSGGNFDPPLDQVVNFEPNLSRNPGAIGLFALAPGDVDVGDVPVDVVIYGDANTGGFVDPTGATPGPVLPSNPDLESMRRTSLAATWEFANPPTPSACPSF